MFEKELIFFGDIFRHPDNGNYCVVTAYFDNGNWWYVEKNGSMVRRAKFLPSDCSWVSNKPEV